MNHYFEWGSHSFLAQYERNIYPYWMLFLYSKDENKIQKIKENCKRDKMFFCIEKYIEKTKEIDFSKYTIIDFMNFIIDNDIDKQKNDVYIDYTWLNELCGNINVLLKNIENTEIQQQNKLQIQKIKEYIDINKKN